MLHIHYVGLKFITKKKHIKNKEAPTGTSFMPPSNQTRYKVVRTLCF